MSTKRILLIYQDGNDTAKLIPELVAGGYIVLRAANIGEGIENARRTAPDIVLLDNDLRDRGLDEFMSEIKAIVGRRIPLVLIIDPQQVAEIDFTRNVAGFVSKPLDAAKIIAHLSLVFQFCQDAGAVSGRSPMDELPAAVGSDVMSRGMGQGLLKDKRALIIDDDRDMVEFIASVLTDEGMQVATAYDGHTGLTKARDGAPDVILLDIMMPGMDGFQVCRLIKFSKRHRHIPVIILTALGDDQSRRTALEVAGADEFITKPFSVAELIRRIGEVIVAAPTERFEDTI